MSELDALDPVPEEIKLTSGTTVVVQRLRARQFFKLLRILTHGALPLVSDGSLFQLDPDSDPGVFVTRLLSLVVLAIPDAEDETIAFLKAMCQPAGLIQRRNLSKPEFARNTALSDQLDAELENPELDDLVTLVEAIVRREAGDIQALGKRLLAMFKLAEKTGQLPNGPSNSPNLASSTSTSSAASAEPSTSSPANTAGTTSSSQTSPSDGSDSVSQPFANAVSTSDGSGSNG